MLASKAARQRRTNAATPEQADAKSGLFAIRPHISTPYGLISFINYKEWPKFAVCECKLW
jgi:hypothetical protein